MAMLEEIVLDVHKSTVDSQVIIPDSHKGKVLSRLVWSIEGYNGGKGPWLVRSESISVLHAHAHAGIAKYGKGTHAIETAPIGYAFSENDTFA